MALLQRPLILQSTNGAAIKTTISSVASAKWSDGIFFLTKRKYLPKMVYGYNDSAAFHIDPKRFVLVGCVCSMVGYLRLNPPSQMYFNGKVNENCVSGCINGRAALIAHRLCLIENYCFSKLICMRKMNGFARP